MAVKGVDKLNKNLKSHNQRIQDNLEELLHAVAPIVAQSISAKAPLNIGDNVETNTTSKTKKRVAVSVGPDEEKWYARFWEYGTNAHKVVIKNAKALKFGDRYARVVNVKGIRKQPFMRPAIDENEQRVLEEARKALKDIAKL